MSVGKLFHIIYSNSDVLQSCTYCYDKNLRYFLWSNEVGDGT